MVHDPTPTPRGSPKTRYRCPLPEDLIGFGSVEGRRLLIEALSAGTAESFHALVAHLHTQAEPAWCGLGALVTVLNALELDPGRTWKGPWRFFGEELLICCKSLELAASEGLSLAEVACLAECNGASAERTYADAAGEARFRDALMQSVRAPAGPFIVANYARASLGQTGAGHFSPLAAIHPGHDLVLVLDVARFKYPPHWVDISRLYRAMTEPDDQTGRPRGWIELDRMVTPRPPRGVARLLDRLTELGAPICPEPPAEAPGECAECDVPEADPDPEDR